MSSAWSMWTPKPRSRRAALCLLAAALPQAAALAADDAPVFRIDMNDGVIAPRRLEVPAGQRIVLEITNSGTSLAEFESREMKKEMGLFPKTKGTVYLKRLDPGEYQFFDDFHPDAPGGVIVAK